MFLLKGLSDIVFGKEDHSILQLPSGQLFYKNPTHPMNPKKLIYKECSATITRTSSPFNYQLLLTRIFEQGEASLDAELDSEKSFLLDTVLKLRLQDLENEDGLKEPTLLWFDPESASGICTWEFVVDMSQTNATTCNLFEQTCYRCMFERKISKSQNEVSEEEFQQFIKSVKALAKGEEVISFYQIFIKFL
jgi:hypothetical protein